MNERGQGGLGFRLKSLLPCLPAMLAVAAAAYLWYPPLQQARYAPAATAPFFDGRREKVGLNTAGVQELMLLPGIGEKRAAAIVEYRQRFGGFDSVEQLLEVPGIGPAILEGLKGLVEI